MCATDRTPHKSLNKTMKNCMDSVELWKSWNIWAIKFFLCVSTPSIKFDPDKHSITRGIHPIRLCSRGSCKGTKKSVHMLWCHGLRGCSPKTRPLEPCFINQAARTCSVKTSSSFCCHINSTALCSQSGVRQATYVYVSAGSQ